MRIDYRHIAVPFGVAVIVLAGFLAACGRFERPAIPGAIQVPAPKPHIGGTYTLDQFDADIAGYNTAFDKAIAGSAGSLSTATALRDKMIDSLLAEIDYVYRNYETRLFINRGSFNVASDFVQLGLAAATTVANGARVKTVLGALLSGVTGTSLSVDKNFFRQQTVQAILSSMQANRSRIKSVITQRKALDAQAYSFQAARSDLIDYFFAGTLASGLQQLHEEAATSAKNERAALNGIQLKDVQDATDYNKGVAEAFKSNDLSKVIKFLQAMGVAISETAPKEKVEMELRALGQKAIVDPETRKKYADEARKAGLLK